MTLASAPNTAHVTRWDRAVVIALGGAGCALSFDALQQMAVAIHVRGPLTHLFPLVIDGFIAYGIRALLVMRDAPLPARLYVWMLFGTATAASIWANALHAVRLNQQTTAVSGLRLSDAVVAVLSTIAPLALAGAVHLYILIARETVKGSDRSDRDDLGLAGHLGQGGQPERIAVTRTDRGDRPKPEPGQVSTGEPGCALTDHRRLTLDKHMDARSLTGASDTEDAGRPDTGHHDGETNSADLPGQLDNSPAASDRPVDPEPVLPPVTNRPVAPAPDSDPETTVTGDRRPDPDTEELLEIARSAVRAEDKLTRKVVAQAIRGQQIPLSSDTLTALMVQLRRQNGQPVTSSQD